MQFILINTFNLFSRRVIHRIYRLLCVSSVRKKTAKKNKTLYFNNDNGMAYSGICVKRPVKINKLIKARNNIQSTQISRYMYKRINYRNVHCNPSPRIVLLIYVRYI